MPERTSRDRKGGSKMAIVRWDPFDAFLGAQADLNRRFQRGWLPAPGTEGSLMESGVWAPAVDIYETGDALVVEAELPGADAKDIDVSVEDGVLTIKGERRQEKELKEENYYRVERAYGMFQRAIRLPADVDAGKVSAGLDGGVLRVTVPKTEPKKAKTIPVKVEQKKTDTRKEKK